MPRKNFLHFSTLFFIPRKKRPVRLVSTLMGRPRKTPLNAFGEYIQEVKDRRSRTATQGQFKQWLKKRGEKLWSRGQWSNDMSGRGQTIPPDRIKMYAEFLEVPYGDVLAAYVKGYYGHDFRKGLPRPTLADLYSGKELELHMRLDALIQQSYMSQASDVLGLLEGILLKKAPTGTEGNRL